MENQQRYGHSKAGIASLIIGLFMIIDTIKIWFVGWFIEGFLFWRERLLEGYGLSDTHAFQIILWFDRLAIIGILLALVGIIQKHKNRKLAVIGLILNLPTFLWILVIFFFIDVLHFRP